MDLRPAKTIRGKLGLTSSLWLFACAAGIVLWPAVRSALPTNTDVSWLLDMGSQWLDGRRPYVDIIEVNPPASLLIYMPAVLAARAFGVSSDLATIVLVTLSAVASLLLSGRILQRGGLLARDAAAPLLFAGLVILLVLPGDCFAEREHIAVLASLPMLAALAARSRGSRLSWTDASLSGLCGGLAVCIKPLFILGFAGPAAVVLLSAGWSALAAAIEILIASLVVAAYAIGVLIGIPAFGTNVLPMVIAAYVPARRDLVDLVLEPVTILWLVALAGWLVATRGRPASLWGKMLMLGSIGFETCVFIQGKGFIYHGLPALILMFMATAGEVCGEAGRAIARPAGAAGFMAGCIAFCLALAVFSQHYDLRRDAPGLEEAIRRVSPNPRMVVLSTDIAVGHPFVTEIGGRWVGSLASNWLASCIARLERSPMSPEARARLERYGEAERRLVAHDIEDARPDVILVDDRVLLPWIEGSAPLMRAFSIYRKTAQYGPIALWTLAPPTQGPTAERRLLPGDRL